MTTRRLLITTLALATAFITTQAFARAPAPIPDTQNSLRTSLERGGFDVRSERVVFTQRGRRDLALFSGMSFDATLKKFQQAKRSGALIGGDVKVLGWAKQSRTDAWTITLAFGTKHYVAKISPDASGTRIALWGAAYESHGMGLPAKALPPAKLPTTTGGTVKR